MFARRDATAGLERSWRAPTLGRDHPAGPVTGWQGIG
jgi:hypothetical protein